MDGISRRDLLKRSAVAGGVLWATPALTSASAWGQGTTCDCDGTLVYTKIAGVAGNDAQTCTNQCLNPDNFQGIGFGCLQDLGYVATTVTSEDVATVEFNSSTISLSKMSLKASASCYMVTCVESFGTVWEFSNSEQDEPKDTDFGDSTPPLFTFEDGDGAALGNSNTGVPAGSAVRKITYDSTDLPHKVDFVEFLLCIKNASRIPCTLEDC